MSLLLLLLLLLLLRAAGAALLTWPGVIGVVRCFNTRSWVAFVALPSGGVRMPFVALSSGGVSGTGSKPVSVHNHVMMWGPDAVAEADAAAEQEAWPVAACAGTAAANGVGAVGCCIQCKLHCRRPSSRTYHQHPGN